MRINGEDKKLSTPFAGEKVIDGCISSQCTILLALAADIHQFAITLAVLCVSNSVQCPWSILHIRFRNFYHLISSSQNRTHISVLVMSLENRYFLHVESVRTGVEVTIFRDSDCM